MDQEIELCEPISAIKVRMIALKLAVDEGSLSWLSEDWFNSIATCVDFSGPGVAFGNQLIVTVNPLNQPRWIWKFATLQDPSDACGTLMCGIREPVRDTDIREQMGICSTFAPKYRITMV